MYVNLLERQRTLSLKNTIVSYSLSTQHRENSCILRNKGRQSMNKLQSFQKILLIF